MLRFHLHLVREEKIKTKTGIIFEINFKLFSKKNLNYSFIHTCKCLFSHIFLACLEFIVWLTICVTDFGNKFLNGFRFFVFI